MKRQCTSWLLKTLLCGICCALSFNGAAKSGHKCWRKKVLTSDVPIDRSATSKDSIVVHYIGCSGFFITKGDNTLLFDPYFSYKVACRQTLLSAQYPEAKVESDINTIFNRSIGRSKDDIGSIDALIIDHAHVDHFGDVPYLFSTGHLNPHTRVIGNNTTGHYLRAWCPNMGIIEPNVEVIAATADKVGEWIYINSTVRVMPVRSEHGPHFKILGKGHSMASNRDEIADVKRKQPLKNGSGQTLCYIVDFLNPDTTVNYRIYHSSASMNIPNGLFPKSLLEEHGIDLAILCAASFNQVSKYPKWVIRYMHPKNIIFSHWEDFMLHSMSATKEHHYKNPVYNYRKLFRRVDHCLNCLAKENVNLKYYIPNIDTRMTFYYN